MWLLLAFLSATLLGFYDVFCLISAGLSLALIVNRL